MNQRPRTRSKQRDRDRERIEEERVEPDTIGDDLEAAITFIGEVCARAATFGEEVNEVVNVGGAGRGGAAGGFLSLAASLSDRD